MKQVIAYLKDYLRTTSRPALIVTMLLVGSLIAANYSLGIERRISRLPGDCNMNGVKKRPSPPPLPGAERSSFSRY